MNLRGEFRRFLTYGVGTISGSALNLILIPLYLSAFSTEEYGIVNILLMLVTFATMFVSAGMMSALQKQFFAVPSEKRGQTIGTVVIWYAAALAVLALVLVVFRTPVSRLFFEDSTHALSVALVAPLVLGTLIVDVPLNVLRLEKRARVYVILSIGRLGVDAALKFLFIVVMELSVIGYLLSTIVSLYLTSGIGFALISKTVEMKFNRSIFRTLLRLSAPFIVTGFAVWSLRSVDRLMLNFLSPGSDVGVYSLGARLGQIYNILFYLPLSTLLPAVIFPLLATRDEARVKRLFARLMNGLVFAGTAVASLITALSIGAIEVISSVIEIDIAYLDARVVIPYMVAANFLYSLNIPAGYTALHIGRTEMLAAGGAVAAVANIALNYLLIRPFGVAGASLATLASFAIYTIVGYWLLQRRFPISYSVGRLGLQLSVFGLCLFFGYSVQVDRGLLGALLVGVVSAAVLALFGARVTGLADTAIVNKVRARVSGRFRRGPPEQSEV